VSQPPITLRFDGRQRSKPPLTSLLFDAELRNDAAEPRWFVLPTALGAVSGEEPGVHSLIAWQLAGSGRVVLGELHGTWQRQCLLLPAGARLTLRRLPVLAWEEDQDLVRAEVRACTLRALWIAGEPAATWFGVDPLCDPDGEAAADERTPLGAHRTQDGSDVPLLADEDWSATIEVELG
jgi:hypothetical protein